MAVWQTFWEENQSGKKSSCLTYLYLVILYHGFKLNRLTVVTVAIKMQSFQVIGYKKDCVSLLRQIQGSYKIFVLHQQMT